MWRSAPADPRPREPREAEALRDPEANGTGGASSGGSTGTGGTSNSGGSTGTGGITATGGTTGSGGSNSGGTTGTGGTTATGGTTGTGGAAGHPAGGSSSGGTTGSGGSTGGSSGSAYTCPTGVTTPSSVPSGSGATKIAGAPPSDSFNNNGNNFTNVEGPVWIGNALYFSEMTGNNPPPARILKIDASDVVTPFFPASGGTGDSGSNGLAVDGQGRLIAASHGVGGIVAFNVQTQTPTTLVNSYNGKRFNSPNDLTIRNDGTIYFSDPSFQAPSPQPQSVTGVYMVPPNGSTATLLLSNLSNPNGVALSLDQKTLYVGHGGGVYSYAVNTDGTIGTSATHVDPSNLDNNATDGMAIDCAGDLYVVRVNQHDIDVVSFGATPGGAGTHLGSIGTIPNAGQLTNIAFGGTDHKTLYITAQGSSNHGVFKLAMPVPGMPY